MYLSEVWISRRLHRPRFISPYLGVLARADLPGRVSAEAPPLRRRFVSPYLGQAPGGGLPGFSPSEERALRITSAFETGRSLSFGGLTGNFDGMGLSFGLLQWNIGSGSLQPLLVAFARDNPEEFDATFGPHAAQLRQLLRQPLEAQLRFARSINDDRNRIVEPWASYFRRLAESPAFQRIQLQHVRRRMNTAADYARQFGLRNERALALMFDNVTQNGPAWLQRGNRAALVGQRSAEAQRRLGRPPNERELLALIANVIADTVNPRWRENVRRRRMTIVEGRGRVHGREFDLEREYGLTDQPWEATPGAGASGAPVPPPAPASQASNGAEVGVIQEALRRGMRDANELANLVFFARHPERQGQPLQRHERQLAREWLDIRDRRIRPVLAAAATPTAAAPSAMPAAPGAPTAVAGPCELTSNGRCVSCGSCEACERRIRAAAPAQLASVPAALRIDPAREIQMDAQALAAYQQLYQAARAAGIPEPYLKIISGYRDYDRQVGLWRNKLLDVFQRLGCDRASLPCLATAIDATSQALRSLPVPHPPNTWLNRFRQELQRANCALPCDPQQAVQIARQGVAPPGASPHHTGRAVDVYVGRAPGAESSASTAAAHIAWQRTQAPFQWLVCNAARFDFYPYNAEPWHWEYNPPA